MPKGKPLSAAHKKAISDGLKKKGRSNRTKKAGNLKKARKFLGKYFGLPNTQKSISKKLDKAFPNAAKGIARMKKKRK